MEEICKAHLNCLERKCEANLSGHIVSKEKYESFLLELTAHGFSFSTRTSETNPTNSSLVKFESGVPGITIQRLYLECCHGDLYYDINKSSNDQDHPSGKKKRFLIQNTKKIGCPSKLHVRIKQVYPDYQADGDTPSEWKKRQISKELKKRINHDSGLNKETWYFIDVSTNHNHQISGQQMPLHPSLRGRIEELIKNGITSGSAIKLHLQEKVLEMFKGEQVNLPSKFNTAFFPNDKTIYSHVSNILFEVKGSKSDQEALQNKIRYWSEVNDLDKFFFRPYKFEEGTKTTPLLFCHQTDDQRKLLQLYGGNTCLLDATYKTTKYSLPLFFIVVKTNFKFMVVGSFICQTEEGHSIAEGLRKFKEWNPNWSPECFVTDYCEAEINALNSVFPETKVFICSFHREQAWLRWTKKTGNIDYGTQKEVVSMFRSVLTVKKEDLEAKIEEIKESELWKRNKKVQSYFTNVWLKVSEKWIPCLLERNTSNNIVSNNGIEVQNRIFKKSYLTQTTDKSLTGTITVLIEKFLPEALTKFQALNYNASSEVKRYNSELPAFLHNRPHRFIKHIMPRYSAALEEFSKEDCILTGHLEAMIKNRHTKNVYVVDFANVMCTCPDFLRWQNLCKHFCACFINIPQLSFEKLPDEFRENPLNNLVNFVSGKEVSFDQVHSNANPQKDEQSSSVPKNSGNLLGRFREELKQLINLTYDVEEGDYVESAMAEVLKIKKEFEKHQTCEDNLPLLKRRKKDHPEPKITSSIIPLPTKDKLKSKFQCRVGQTADMWKASSNLNVKD